LIAVSPAFSPLTATPQRKTGIRHIRRVSTRP
jgi:hypothetical protein